MRKRQRMRIVAKPFGAKPIAVVVMSEHGVATALHIKRAVESIGPERIQHLQLFERWTTTTETRRTRPRVSIRTLMPLTAQYGGTVASGTGRTRGRGEGGW